MLSSQVQGVEHGSAGFGPPGLMAWQVYFLAYVAGIWALRHQEPALAATALLWLGLVLFRRPGPASCLASLALTAACFAGGQAHARHVLPAVPAEGEAILAVVAHDRAKALLSARVAEVTDKPFGRIEILLEDARATPAPPSKRDAQPAATANTSPDAAPAAPGVESAAEPTLAVPGRIAWDWDEPGLRPAPGQRVEVVLRLRPVHGFANRGGGDFEWQQRLRGVFFRAYTRGPELDATWGAPPPNALWELREGLRGRLLSDLPQTQGGALVLGLLLGDRSRIGQDVTEELRAAGLSHTLALSGLNVVYVAVLGLGLAWAAGLAWPGLYLRIPRQKLAILLSFPLVAAYVWLGQGSPSLVRSAWMFAFWGLFILLDRGRALVDGLFLALALIVLWDPLAVYDIGLQMSALAVAGLAFLHPWLNGLVPPARGPVLWLLRRGWEAFAMTLAANLALLPVSLWYFGSYPPNFLLNLLWLPVQGLVVQLFGMAGMALAALPGLGSVAGPLLAAAASTQDFMLAGLHQLHAAGWFPTWAVLRPLWPELLGAALVLAVAPYCCGPHGRVRRGQMPELSLPVLLLISGLLLTAWPHVRMLGDDARDELRLTVLDVGQSQAVLVQASGGRRVLIDGGGAMSPTFDIGRSVVGPALAWGRPPRLDAVVLTHPDADHAQGLGWVLAHFEVGRLLTNGQWPQGRLAEVLDAALAQGVNAGRLRPQAMAAGEALELGPGVALVAQHPARDYAATGTNDNSLVLRLVWRGHGLALLPGDVQRDGIEDMLERRRDLRAGVLLLPHHGSKSSLSGLLYEAVDPRLALVSCGFQNQYRFPNKDVAAELAGRGIELFGTPERGMMELVWRAPGAAPRLDFTRP
ncbi:ComEC/Rec2 family competence protein [Humidesulfovibrio sp.]